MAELGIISICTVRPATRNESTRRIELTPWDLQLLLVDSIQKGLLFLKPKSQHSSIDHLKTSLSRTLDFFPPLAGRIAATKNHDNTTSFFIDCNDSGAQFAHAIVNDLTVADILEPVCVPRIVRSFFPLNGVRNHEGVSKPLLAVQLTELMDGFFIGCTINHLVGDGTSFWHFFNSWSEIARGFEHISKPPVLKRWFPDPTNCPIHIPFFDEQLKNDRYLPPPLKERVFHFTKANIANLKAKANAEMVTDRISSLQALLAHLWRSVIRCCHVDANQETNLKPLIGARPRLDPPLSEGYFGNAVHLGAVTTTAGELLEHGLGWAAWQMNKMVSLYTHEEVRNFYESWMKTPKVVKLGVVTSNALIISSSPRFNVYGNDFGWGKPVAVRSGVANKSDGKITVFPGVDEGSVDIEACLLPETLHAMGDDQEFMEEVTTSMLSSNVH